MSYPPLELHVRLPGNVCTAKQLNVVITSKEIKVNSRLPGHNASILEGQLSGKCKASEAMWSISGGTKLNICIGMEIVSLLRNQFNKALLEISQTKRARAGGRNYLTTKRKLTPRKWIALFR